MMRTSTLGTLVLLVASATAVSASANPSGRVQGVWMTPMYKTKIWMDANVPFVFETTNLVAGSGATSADTVIHIQADDANGGFLAGNDDYSGLASRVDLTVTTSQYVNFIVRAYSDTSYGTARANVWRNGVIYQSASVSFAGRSIFVTTGMPVATHVMTVENFNGPRDSLLVVVSDNAAHAINFDDDDGIDLQSWLHLDSACSAAYCRIIYGRYYNGEPDGYGTVIWDGDVHNGLDADSDGLGNTLESLVGTNPYLADTDNDGLSDSAELVGVDNASQPVKLATWGANPTSKDMFVEVDWLPCPTATDPTCGGNANAWQMPSTDAVNAHNFFQPDINVHFDIGTQNTATTLAEWSIWGNWGGASQAAWADWCGTLSASRVGLFHHFHTTSDPFGGGGQTSGTPSTCSYGSGLDRTVAHELGHQIGLSHEGNTGSGKINSKPNYPSMINYGYAYDAAVTFSRGVQPTLTPTALTETGSGLSTQLLTTLGGGSWAFKTDPTNKKIDWNRDGQYDTSSVRGAPTWIFTNAPETTGAWSVQDLEDGSSPTMARMGTAKRFFLFTRRTADNKLQYRYTTSFDSCSGGDGVGSCVTWTGPTAVSKSLAASAPGAVACRATISGAEKLVLVYSDTTGKMYYQYGDTSSWTSPSNFGTGDPNFKPALFSTGSAGLRLLYKDASSGKLYQRDFTVSTKKWGAGTPTLNTSGGPLLVNYGVSVTKGYDASSSKSNTYMALVDSANSNKIELYQASAGSWGQLTSVWASGQPTTISAPSIAYVPFTSSDATKGQLYLVYHYQTKDASGNITSDYNAMMKTEGNDLGTSATVRRFKWVNGPIPMYNYWGTADGNAELLFEIGVDKNLRATWKMVDPRKTWFHPVADGIADLTLKDGNDYYYMVNTLSCSLGHGGCISL